MSFTDRTAAGRLLAERLTHLRGQDVVVLGLPRGGVPVAAEVAAALGAPLDVIVVRKLGVPYNPELAMGAIGEGGVRVLNERVLRRGRIEVDEIARVEHAERAELARRVARFRGDAAPVPLAGRTAVIVDDGIATGSTARAACQVARAQGAAWVVLAVPVAAPDVLRWLGRVADEVVCLQAPSWFVAVGEWYDSFPQVGDHEVMSLLRGARTSAQHDPAAAGPAVRDDEVTVEVGDQLRLSGHLTVPPTPRGIVVFAHGSGSSRHSPRNRYVAGVLNRVGLATLLFDLLTSAEEAHRANVFDIDLLGGRLAAATDWVRGQPGCTGLPVGYFGASTGAAAALWAASQPGTHVAAVVSRGGRPDLAGSRLPGVTVPTLLIVGGRDPTVLDLNRQAAQLLAGETDIAVVPAATHLFEEPGTLAKAASLATVWFTCHLAPTTRPTERATT